MIHLDGTDPPIGIIGDSAYDTIRQPIAPGASLLLYSDGVTEVFVQPGKLWGSHGLQEFVSSQRDGPAALLDGLRTRVAGIAGKQVLDDDYSTILATFA
jgi:serine phosphatase RsbU (regulator of sigma subunit)